MCYRARVKVFVSKSEFRLWVTIDDKVLFERPVGLGRDGRTPTGSFVIRVKEVDPVWYPSGSAPVQSGDPRNVLGSRWLGFEETERHSGLGIHGTTDPSSIGRESSAGCVRMLNRDVELLYDFVPYKTVVDDPLTEGLEKSPSRWSSPACRHWAAKR